MGQNNEKERPQPIKVVKRKVSPVEVGKYYLKSEFSRVFPAREVRSEIDNTIGQLSDKDFWRLFEAMSFSFRLNGVFWRVSDSSLAWSEEVWDAGELTMTGIDPTVNKVVRSPQVESNPVKFVVFLKDYFKKHTKDDPSKLGQFRPDDRDVTYPKVILMDNGSQIKLLDGSNRLIKLLMLGEREVTALVGRETGSKGKIRIGDSTFWLLRNMYQRSQPYERGAIFKTARKLGEVSSDGEEAIKSYWIRHVTNEELRKVGERLLESVRSSAGKAS